jgi:hypothetical protein
MTSRRSALYLAGGALFVACLAGANMPSPRADRPGERSPAGDADGPAALAEDVRSQATRLQSRMAQAPVPENSPRNPFAFAAPARSAASAPAHAPAPAAPVVEAAAALPPIPALTLMGIAEEAVPGGVRRTAIISLGEGADANPIAMVTEGESVGDRYKVTKIGADAVELEDLVTKAYRRIAMR